MKLHPPPPLHVAPATPAPRSSVTRRLRRGITALLLSVLVLAALAQWRTLHLSQQVLAQVIERDQRLVDLVRWRGLEAANAERSLASLGTSDGDLLMAYEQAIAQASKEIEAQQQALQRRTVVEPDTQQALRTLAEQRQALAGLTQAVAALALQGDVGEVQRRVQSQVTPGVQAYLKALDHLIVQQTQARSQVQAEAQAAQHRLALVTALAGLAALAAGLLLAHRLTRAIGQPLNAAVEWSRRIAEGDLSAPPLPNRQDEFGVLLDALGRMAARLREIVSEVRAGVELVSTASHEIAAGNQELSVRTEQAAARLQHTAASLEQLRTAVADSTQAVLQTDQHAEAAATQAREGDAQVQRVAGQMTVIQGASLQIAEITTVIDGIALQTQLLALNAATEAARAGEHGRGFGVVAVEVRRLAQRAADAAASIRGLIGQAQAGVDTGTHLVTLSREAMADIVARVQHVNVQVRAISGAAQQQHAEVDALNAAVLGIDQMTQQNAALVEQSAAAAASLRDQAQRLAQLVAVFRV